MRYEYGISERRPDAATAGRPNKNKQANLTTRERRLLWLVLALCMAALLTANALGVSRL